MKFFIAVSIALVWSTLVVAEKERDARIVKQDQELQPDGSYSYAYETDNGITASQKGLPVDLGSQEGSSVVVQGHYRYTAPDGTPVVINYVADQNGYKAEGDQLPVAPPIPAIIEKSLAYIAAHSTTEANKSNP